MIHLCRKIGPFLYERKWFARQVSFWERFRFVSFRQYLGSAPAALVRRRFQTIHIDLAFSEEHLLATMKKNTVYEIRRAEKEAVSTDELAPADTKHLFQHFYNAFALRKGLSLLSQSQIDSFGSHLLVSRARHGGGDLVMHAWLFDQTEGRTRLLYSATTVDPGIDRGLIGRANRLLHYRDLLSQKMKGFRVCDLGGVAGDPEKSDTAGIDQFKFGFGGKLCSEDHFDSIPLVAADQLKAALSSLKRSFAKIKKGGSHL